jgi:hypothetical protein
MGGKHRMFDPHDPYERYYWHYESRRPLSMAQIIALESVDAETVALIWLLLEHGASMTIAGPTDPQPGIGKTTTLNALLQFLPEGTTLEYMSGMYEKFAFTRHPDVNPATTYALCNEVSDHLAIYMWGRVARRYLMLPHQGYHIATSVHADAFEDVVDMYQNELHLRPEDIRLLGVVVNMGLVRHTNPARRCWFSTYFFQPQPDPVHPDAIVSLPLSLWNEATDTFEHADGAVLHKLAAWMGMTSQKFVCAYDQRVACLQELAQYGADMGEMLKAIRAFRQQNK